ncbi:MAG: hypothetical protein GF308_11580 [Candidatus Heimdallarchaeota archaeon]|nr:hypothetical protein [Candidatus Heimdallarchaeota archaeon]
MNKRALYGSITVIVILLGVAALCGFGYWKIGQQSLLPNGGEFNAWLIGATIENPYSSGKVVVRSDEQGKGYIDLQRSSWWNDPTISHDPNPFGETIPTGIDPYYDDLDRTDGEADFAWLTGPVSDFDAWASNSWSAVQGCTIDPDAKASGVPDLSITIANMYPADSNGNSDASYGHVLVPKTFEDADNNQRNYEIHIGYIVVEIVFSIRSDYFENPEKYGDAFGGMAYCTSETGGSWRRVFDKLIPTYGAELDFSATFRLDLVGLEIDGFYLNPSWLEGGNGVMELKKTGFGPIVDPLTGKTHSSILTQDTSDWSFQGDNNIEETSYSQLNRYATAQEAIDKSSSLPAEDVHDIEFKQQTPDKIYWNLDYTIELGDDFDNTNWIGTTKEDSKALQSIDFNQRVLVKFYTSQCEPLGPDGNDPLTITREPDEDKDDYEPPNDFFDRIIQGLKNIWSTIVNDWFSGRQWLAILTAAGIGLAVILIAAGVFGGPGAVILILKLIFFPITALIHLVKAAINRRSTMA